MTTRSLWLLWAALSALTLVAAASVVDAIQQPVRGTTSVSEVARWFEGGFYSALTSAALLAIPTSGFLIASRRHLRTGVKVIVAALVSQIVVLGWEVSMVQREPRPPPEERYQRWLQEG
jgi:hypothetical protein